MKKRLAEDLAESGQTEEAAAALAEAAEIESREECGEECDYDFNDLGEPDSSQE